MFNKTYKNNLFIKKNILKKKNYFNKDYKKIIINSFISNLLNLNILKISGKNIIDFLNKKITQNLKKLNFSNILLTGCCNYKGKLLSIFIIWKNKKNIFIQIPLDIQLSLKQYLIKFILHNKINIKNISKKKKNLGFFGNINTKILQKWFPQLPILKYKKIDNKYGTLMRISNNNLNIRYQLILNNKLYLSIINYLKQKSKIFHYSIWNLTNIYTGIPYISLEIQNIFLPQIIGLDILKAISFNKGCYLGQEIISKYQFSNKIKTNNYIALVFSNIKIKNGEKIFFKKKKLKYCGTIINSEFNGIDMSLCLITIKLNFINNLNNFYLLLKNKIKIKLLTNINKSIPEVGFEPT